jgi:hypothetical protein
MSNTNNTNNINFKPPRDPGGLGLVISSDKIKEKEDKKKEFKVQLPIILTLSNSTKKTFELPYQKVSSSLIERLCLISCPWSFPMLSPYENNI